MASKTKETERNYIERALKLMSKALKEAITLNEDIVLEAEHHTFDNKQYSTLSIYNTSRWAASKWAHTLKHTTWRQYRASLIFYAEKQLKDEKISLELVEKIKSLLAGAMGGNKNSIEKRTSAWKAKHLQVKDLKILDSKLKESKNIWSDATRLWLRAGVLTGARPIEWQTAKFITKDNQHFLLIKNAKNTNDRANGEYRTINLNHLEKNEINVIRQHLLVVDKIMTEDSWDDYYKGCSNILRYTARKIWPNRKKYPTLYSSRHQFSANIKASGCSTQEVAALMGHASDRTAQEHYGKKIMGTRGRRPKVSEREVTLVRKTKQRKIFSFSKKKN